MDLLSRAKRKDALPDPAKIINPLLLKRDGYVAQKGATETAVTSPVDRASLIIKGQPSAGVAVSGSTFHCSVEQVVGGKVVVSAAQAKGSDIASDTSFAQLSRHNPDDVMESIPEDYGSRELVHLLELVR